MPWVKGQSGNPAGGKRGPRAHKLRFETMAWADLVNDWKDHGAAAIEHVRKNDPTSYFRICAGLLTRIDDSSPVNHQHQIEVILKPPAWLTDDTQSPDTQAQAIDITPQSNETDSD